MYENVIVGGAVDVVVWLVKVFEVPIVVGFVSVLGGSLLLEEYYSWEAWLTSVVY
jgi:hypothetical protein